MKKFRVEIEVKATETYYVEADSEEDALEKVKNGDYKKNDYSIDIHTTYYDDADISEE